MDNVTHTLSGLALARAGLERLGPGSTITLVLAANAPDLDIVAGFRGSLAYLEYHRGFTHGVLGAVLLALGIALAVRFFVKDARLGALCLAGVAGTSLHIVMDLWTTYGTRALLPFDAHWYAWDLVFIVDPWILGALALGLLLGRRAAWRHPAALVAIGLVSGYVLARAGLHERALELARQQLTGESLVRLTALPTPLNPLRWRILADTGDAFSVGPADLRTGRVALTHRAKTPVSEAVTIARERSPVAAAFLAFSPYPWLEVRSRDGGTEVTWKDLRFENRARQGFVARVLVGPDGRIVSEGFSF